MESDRSGKGTERRRDLREKIQLHSSSEISLCSKFKATSADGRFAGSWCQQFVINQSKVCESDLHGGLVPSLIAAVRAEI